MKRTGFHSSVDVSTPPATPNFDDEVTVLTARPVVPLEEIDSKIRRRRRWLLGGAFAVAMMLGAASALIASYIRLRTVPEAASEISEVEVTPESVAVAEPVASDSAVDENLEEIAIPVTPKRSSTVRQRRTSMRSDSESSHSRGERQLSEEEELRRIREGVLIDQWQERRQRRVERRERRNRGNGGGRDLSHLDEIFEGPRRP